MLPGKTITPLDIVAMVRRRIWWLVIPPIVTLFGALLYSSRVPDVYQSDMLIAIDPQRVPDAYVRSTVTLGTERRMSAISVQVTSRTNLEQMIEEHNLYPNERELLPMEDVVALMREGISVELERARGQDGPTAFHVRFTHSDPEIAAKVTEGLGTLFVQQNAQDRGALADATNTFLETQLREARERLESQERKLERFREQHGQSLPTQMPANLQTLQNKQLQAQTLVESLARDLDRRQLLERLYEAAATESAPLPPAPDGSSTAPATVLTAQQRLLNARAELTELERRYTQEHPDVARLKRQISTLERAAADEAGLVAKGTAGSGPKQEVADPIKRQRLQQMALEMESLDRQIAFKESEERRLRSEIGTYQARIESVPGLESEWVALTRDYDTQQATYKDLLSKSENAKLAAALEEQKIGEHFRIVDPARVPVHPLPSVRAKVNVAGLALGLVFGLAVAGLLEFRDASFRSSDEVFEVLNLPVLAIVPRIQTNQEQRSQFRRTSIAAACGVIAMLVVGYVVWIEQLWKGLR